MQALFLGAGASYDCGMPLVSELTAELRRWLTKEKLENFNSMWRTHGGGWSDESISMFLRLLENKSIHYENIIGAIEVNFSRETNVEKRKELHAINSFLLQAVYGLLVERQVKNFPFAMGVLEDFGSITKLVEANRPLWVFSLNHDLMFELLAANFSIPVKTGFNEKIEIIMGSGDEKRSVVNFERLSREAIKKNGYDFFAPGEAGINLIKLHGSLDMFAQGDDLNYLKLVSNDGNSASYIEQLTLINAIDLSLGQRSGVRAVNEHTYVDSEGQIQFLRNSLLSGAHKFSPRTSQVAPPEFMSIFRGYLNYASELICIGYGFGDRHIDEPIVDWLSHSSHRRLNVVNPGISSCPPRYGHLYEQVSLTPQGAGEYFLRLGDNTGSVTQKLMRKIRAEKRKKMMQELLA